MNAVSVCCSSDLRQTSHQVRQQIAATGTASPAACPLKIAPLLCRLHIDFHLQIRLVFHQSKPQQ
jgi:hypothetical protein